MITAIVMAESHRPPGDTIGQDRPARWVQAARRAATRDLLAQLGRRPLVDRLILISPEAGDLVEEAGFEHVVSPPGPIHVGRTLADAVSRFHIQRLLYFGGASAPLLDDYLLDRVIARLAATESVILSNNRFASDWAGIEPATAIIKWQERLPKDNMLGWVLSAEAGLAVETLPPSTASRLDIDTPDDLLVLKLHPATKTNLRRALDALPLDTGPMRAVLEVLARPASQIFIAGRLAPEAWSALNRVTKCWLRVVSEERGLVSSGRLDRGEAYSILGDYCERLGLPAFFEMLANQAEAALIDSRVMMAHHGRWPSAADRFASDLGLIDQIEDPWLRDFTAQAVQAPIPILLGGHGLLSGDLYALCDLLRSRQGD